MNTFEQCRLSKFLRYYTSHQTTQLYSPQMCHLNIRLKDSWQKLYQCSRNQNNCSLNLSLNLKPIAKIYKNNTYTSISKEIIVARLYYPFSAIDTIVTRLHSLSKLQIQYEQDYTHLSQLQIQQQQNYSQLQICTIAASLY